MARITRKELKTDKFAQEIEQTVTFFEEHRAAIIRFGSLAVVVALLVFGYIVYSRHRHTARQDALYQALEAIDAPVAAAPGTPGLNFPNQAAKDQEVIKRLTALRVDYAGSDEASVAGYYLATTLAEQGKQAEAEKILQDVAENGSSQYAALAKLSLAHIYFGSGKADLGEKTLRDLIDHPTTFVTKEQATIALARALKDTKPQEAHKLLQPLLNKPGEASQMATALNSEIPQ